MQGIVLDRSRLCTLSTAASDRPPVKDICSVVMTLFRGLLLDIMLKVGIFITTLLPWGDSVKKVRIVFKHTLVQFLCKTIATNNKMCKWLYNVNYENCCTTSITNTGRGHRKFFSAYNKCELGWKVFTREPEKPTNSISFVILVGKRFLFKTPCKIRKSWFWVNWKRNVAFFKWLLSSTMMIMIMIARYYLGGSKDIRRLKVPTPRRTPP